ncbi:hypothetical protein ACS0TY_023360 [Phlomoides rotata]
MGSGDGHHKAHHDLQATSTRHGKATLLGVRGSIIPAPSRTSYSSFFKISALGCYTCNNECGPDFPFILYSFTMRESHPHQSKWWKAPLSIKRRAFVHLSPRDRIWDLNRPKESEEATTFRAHGKASSFWSTSQHLHSWINGFEHRGGCGRSMQSLYLGQGAAPQSESKWRFGTKPE